MSIRSVTVACLMAIVASSAAIAAGDQEREWRAACARDAFAHCTFKALAGDREGVRVCLVKHLDKISSRCRAVVEGASADGVATNDAGVQAEQNPGSSASDKTPRSN